MPGTDAPAPSLRVAAEQRDGWLVVRVRGELTFRTCDELAGVLAGAGGAAGQARVAVEASALEFFDSAGVRCLVSACRRARRAG